MKRTAFLLALCLGACTPAMKLRPGDHVLLRDGWTLAHGGIRVEASVPSTVAGTLAEHGLFDGDRPSEADTALFSGTWTWTKTFRLDDPSLHYTLRFDGLNYRADISLNGVRLAGRDTTAGVFCVRDFDVSGIVGKRNTLTVALEKARPGDLNIGFVDWNPAPPDASAGIVRDVTLSASGPVSMKDVYVRSTLPDDLSEADLDVQAILTNHTDETVEVVLEGQIEQQTFRSVVTLAPRQVREVHLDKALHIASPRLWWSRDLGSPELYGLTLTASVENAVSDASETTFGIRSLKSGLDEHGHRAFWLNGRKLLLLGGGWTDDLYLRDTPESLERQVRQVADMNLNCIRFENIWGKDPTIYDLCDRYGILALVGWSCQWEWEGYCGIPHDNLYGCILDEAHNALAVRYFQDQVKWIRRHPSVIGWLTGSDRIPNPDLEAQYLQILPALSDIPYICSASSLGSLAGPSGNKMVGPYEYVGPEYWYDPQHRLGSAWGFNTETSIGMNIPQLESLRRMLGNAVWPLGPAWDAHCTSAGEGMHDTRVMEEVIAGQYGPATTLEGFVARAQAVDYDGTRAMFEAFRVHRGETTGLIQWMLNSAWPSLYWQLYDWYGVPTAGYYGVKKGCEPVQVLYDWQARSFHAVNSTAVPVRLDTEIRLYDATSRLIGTFPVGTDIPACGTVALPGISLPGEDFFAFTGTGNAYAIPARGSHHVWERSNWFQTPIDTWADLRFVTSLPQPDLSVETISDGKGNYTVTVRNNGPAVVWQIVLKLLDRDGHLIVPAWWSDNFFPLEPGAVRTLTCTADDPAATVAWTAGLGS